MDAEAQDSTKDQGPQDKPAGGKSSARRKPASGGILPKVAAEDEPGSWGDGGGYDHDAWLKEQRPPHWG
jgi:hypothetical protein